MDVTCNLCLKSRFSHLYKDGIVKETIGSQENHPSVSSDFAGDMQ